MTHEVPSHRWMSVWLLAEPTAQHSAGDAHVTLAAPAGAVTIDHEVPSQCWILLPTAQQSEADEHATALSALLLGEVTIDQPGVDVVVANPSAEKKRPTAQSISASKRRGLKKLDGDAVVFIGVLELRPARDVRFF